MTPIDPTAFSTEIHNAYESRLTGKSVRPKGHVEGLLAVARSVCPEHHAVYDTRTHVAVPIGMARTLIGALTNPNRTDDYIDQIVAKRYITRDEGDAFKYVRSLLPTEEAND